MPRPFLILALALTLAAATRVARPSKSATPPQSSRAELHLKNSRWDAIQVEVRIGTADSCDLNTDAWVRTLRKGQAWAVVGDVQVCWRREATPGSAAATTVWAPWQRPAFVNGTATDADL